MTKNLILNMEHQMSAKVGFCCFISKTEEAIQLKKNKNKINIWKGPNPKSKIPKKTVGFIFIF